MEGGHRRVVAAGNLGRHAATQGYATIAVPGNDPFVITVKPDQPLPKQPQAQPVPQPASEDHLDAGCLVGGRTIPIDIRREPDRRFELRHHAFGAV